MAVLGAAWGREVEVDHTGPFPMRVYSARRERVADMLIDACRFGDRVHVVDGEDRLTFAEHEAAVNRVAGELAARGVGAGTRVMLLGWNGIAWVLAYWAIHRAGGVVVLGNPWWSATETAEIIADVAPGLTIVDHRLRDRVSAGESVMSFPELRAVAGRDAAPSGLPELARTEHDPAVIMFSAGTTGRPKGVVLPQRSVLVNVHSVLNVSHALPHELAPERPQSVALLTLPLFHAGGLQTLGVNLMAGSRMVFLTGRFDAGRALQIIEEERVTHWAGVPTMLTRMMDHPDLARRDTASLRSIVLAGATIPQQVRDRIAATFANVRTGGGINYGLTEAGGTVCSATAAQAREHPGTVGRPMPVAEIRIVADDEFTGVEGVGEIVVRSPALMLGYWGESTSPIVDGWLHTGDLGRIDDDDWIYLVGRKKDIIIRGGENIASAPVEERLRAHPDVLDAAVLGLPHDDLGEEVAAVIVRRPGAEPDPEALAGFLAPAVARFAVPTRWWIRDEELPTSAVGKVLKRSLLGEFPGA